MQNGSEQQPQIYLLLQRKCTLCADAPWHPIAAVINNSKSCLPGGRYTPNSSWNCSWEVKFVTNKFIDALLLFHFVLMPLTFPLLSSFSVEFILLYNWISFLQVLPTFSNDVHLSTSQFLFSIFVSYFSVLTAYSNGACTHQYILLCLCVIVYDCYTHHHTELLCSVGACLVRGICGCTPQYPVGKYSPAALLYAPHLCCVNFLYFFAEHCMTPHRLHAKKINHHLTWWDSAAYYEGFYLFYAQILLIDVFRLSDSSSEAMASLGVVEFRAHETLPLHLKKLISSPSGFAAAAFLVDAACFLDAGWLS